MKIRKHIKRILLEFEEDLTEKTKFEKLIKSIVLKKFEGKKLPKNFYDIAVDILENRNPRNESDCKITVLFKKPFSTEDSDFFSNILREVAMDLRTFFIGKLSYVSTGSTTVDHYLKTRHLYT